MEFTTASLSVQAYDQIRQKIICLELAPGAIIDENSLQAELDLGRTPIREALLRLSQEKLINIVPRRGIFVSEISISHLQQLFEMRLALEPVAARLASQRGSDQQFIEYQRVLEACLTTPPEQKNEAFIQADRACHQILYEASANKLLEDALRILYALSHRLWNYSRIEIDALEPALSPHNQILAALKNRDGELAGDLIEQHVRKFQEEIRGAMLGITNSS